MLCVGTLLPLKNPLCPEVTIVLRINCGSQMQPWFPKSKSWLCKPGSSFVVTWADQMAPGQSLLVGSLYAMQELLLVVTWADQSVVALRSSLKWWVHLAVGLVSCFLQRNRRSEVPLSARAGIIVCRYMG
jgi:hypothetical protein